MAYTRPTQSAKDVFSNQPTSVINPHTHGESRQDKSALTFDRRASGQPAAQTLGMRLHPLRSKNQRSQKQASDKRRLVPLTIQLQPLVKAELQRIAEHEYLSISRIGAAASYVSGGSGLTGIATCWPSGSPCDPGGVSVSPAAAASAIDHYWLQYNPPIVYSFTTPQSVVVAVSGIDHGPLPGEALEFIVWGSNDGTTLSEEGAIIAVFDDGVDGSVGAAISGPGGSTNIGLSDDFSSLWMFNNSYNFFIVTAGDHIASFSSPGEGEIDGLAVARNVKVTICHKGNTITVGAEAVAAHISQHGDTVGPCP